jgi:small subunit ribosomal protein S16
MPLRIRLARHGRKRNAYYHIVAADSRAPRDGKFIERLGNYNPNTNPATIELNFERALYWLQNGAQPSDTTRAILSYKGVLMKKHLLDGVKKGAFDENAAEEKFSKWMTENTNKIQSKVEKLKDDKQSSLKTKMAAEKKVSTDRAQAIAEKNAEAAKAAAKAASKADEPEVEEAEPEAPAVEEAETEAPAVEEKKEE